MTQLQPLASLEFKPRAAPAGEVGKRGDLCWIPLNKLRIDPTYQRHILETGKANIRRMIERFSWLKFGTVTVGARDGGLFAVIDGQHRATAAMLHGGINSVPCLVLRGSRQDEAMAFSSINGNVTRIHVLQSFRAKVASGDKEANALVDLCGEVDVTIAPYPKTELKPGETLGLGTLLKSKKDYGDACLQAALTLLRKADPELGIAAAAIQGTACAVSEGQVSMTQAKKIGAFLATRDGAGKLVEQARQRRATRGGTEWRNFAALVAGAIGTMERAGGQDMRRLMAGR